jgi:DNA-binding NtrC family response regulator
MGTTRMQEDAIENSVAEQLVGRTLKQVERALIIQTLIDVEGNRSRAATVLGISVRCLRDKIRLFKELGVVVPNPVDAHAATPSKDE